MLSTAVRNADRSSRKLHPWLERTAVIIGRQAPTTQSPLDALTKAELRVAAAISRGLSNRDAADNLFLSPKTVDSHLQRIYRKLGVSSRTELAILISGAPRTSPAGNGAW